MHLQMTTELGGITPIPSLGGLLKQEMKLKELRAIQWHLRIITTWEPTVTVDFVGILQVCI